MKIAINKLMVAASLALPIIAASAAAQAGTVTSDQRYTPNSSRANNLPSPFDKTIINYGAGNYGAYNYVGGPKTGTRGHR